MLPFKEIKYVVDEVPKNIECLLGADIGGTNSNFGFFQLADNKLTLYLPTLSLSDQFHVTHNQLLQNH